MLPLLEKAAIHNNGGGARRLETKVPGAMASGQVNDGRRVWHDVPAATASSASTTCCCKGLRILREGPATTAAYFATDGVSEGERQNRQCDDHIFELRPHCEGPREHAHMQDAGQ